MSKTKEYSQDDTTVLWKPDLCIHSENCFKGLPSVFNPKNRPWVNMDGDDNNTIREQVSKCPSGALSIKEAENGSHAVKGEQQVEVVQNGPLMVYGNISIKMPDGSGQEKHSVTAFCRCGASHNKPYCDGSHKKTGFKG